MYFLLLKWLDASNINNSNINNNNNTTELECEDIITTQCEFMSSFATFLPQHFGITTKGNKNNNNNSPGEKSEDIIRKPYVSDTVVNLSNFFLTEPQIQLLSKGLKFCPIPGEPNQGDL